MKIVKSKCRSVDNHSIIFEEFSIIFIQMLGYKIKLLGPKELTKYQILFDSYLLHRYYNRRLKRRPHFILSASDHVVAQMCSSVSEKLFGPEMTRTECARLFPKGILGRPYVPEYDDCSRNHASPC